MNFSVRDDAGVIIHISSSISSVRLLNHLDVCFTHWYIQTLASLQ